MTKNGIGHIWQSSSLLIVSGLPTLQLPGEYSYFLAGTQEACDEKTIYTEECGEFIVHPASNSRIRRWIASTIVRTVALWEQLAEMGSDAARSRSVGGLSGRHGRFVVVVVLVVAITVFLRGRWRRTGERSDARWDESDEPKRVMNAFLLLVALRRIGGRRRGFAE